MTRALVAALAVMLLCAPVLPFTAASPAAAAPGGMATIPDSNVAEDVPTGESIPLSASELQGGVLASEHADSLEVVLTTADHAPTVMDSDAAAASGNGMAVVLRDSQQSAGREVAIDAGQLQQALGYKPQAIYGTHEDGSEWTASAEYVDGYLVFDVPHFSSNTVTFSGEVTIDATGATNGTQFEYDISQDENVSDASLTLTGVSNTQDTFKSKQFGSSGAIDFDVSGSEDANIYAEITSTSGLATSEANAIFTDTHPSTRNIVAISGDGETGIRGEYETLHAVDLSGDSYTKKFSYDLGSSQELSDAQIDYDGEIAAASYGSDNTVAVLNLTNDASPHIFDIYDNGEFIRDIDVTPDGDYVAVATDASVIVADTTNPSSPIVMDISPGSWVGGQAVSISDDGSTVVAGGFDGGSPSPYYAFTFDVTSASQTGKTKLTDGESIAEIEIDADGDRAIAATGNNNAYILDPTSPNDAIIYGYNAGSAVSGADISQNGQRALIADGSGSGTYLDTTDAVDPVIFTTSLGGSGDYAEISSDGNTGMAVGDSAVLLDLTDTTTPERVEISSPEIYDSAFASSGKRLAIMDNNDGNPLFKAYNMDNSVNDPQLTIEESQISKNGKLEKGASINGSETLQPGSYTAEYVANGGEANISLSWTETTVTEDPAVRIVSDDGTQNVDYTGTLSDGATTTLTESIDESRIGGSTTVTVTVDDPASGPAGQVELNYSHTAQDEISTSYEASTFEESYNVSHTYADATENAQVTIPFASSRVVSVGNVEYRVDGGAWNRVASANYRLNGTTLDVYLDDATGGVEAGQTVDVRATGRKIDVGYGAVTVTDPTAPGEELDTQLQIDSRSEDFHVNVGPTDDGDRVHYAYADGFPTEDYVVIESNGDQDLYLPNAVTGDRVRVRHLDTRVVAEQGDVRIDVVKAGENPELDVSPGPGGPGDTVTVEYYNTESGVTYLLNSLTRSIVIDSDTAQSPAIFEADDSDETWTILRDSGPSGSSSSGGGAVGQFQRQAADTVGSLSLPIGGSGLGQLALLGVLGLGGVLVLRRLFGDDDMGEDTGTASGGAGSGGSGLVGRATGLVGSLGSVGGRAARGAGSGLLAGLQRVLDFFGRVTEVILGNRRASIAAAVVAAIVAARVGLVQLPQGTGILIVVSGVPLATWLIMRRSGAVSRSVWLASTVAAVILGLEFVAPGTVQTAIEQLTSEDVAPLLILVGAGAAYLWYRSRQSDRPQIIIGGDDES